LIWEAYAKRGLGFSANQGSSGSTGDGTEGYDVPDFCSFLGATPDSQQICAGTAADFDVVLGSAYTGNVTMSASGNPAPSTTNFTPNPVAAPGNTTFTVGNTAGVAPGLYTITITGTEVMTTANTTVDLEVVTAAPGAPTLLTPPNGATGTSTSAVLTWSAVANATGYTVEVATDAGFTNIIHTNSVAGTTDTVNGLAILTQYFWRVRAENTCGTGVNSAVFNFTTGQEFCSSSAILIPGTGTSGPAAPYPSDIVVGGIGTNVTDVNLRLEGLSHTYPDDIDMLLVGPQGQNLIFMSDAGLSGDVVNVELIFDDSAGASLPDSGQITSGTYLPTNYGAGDTFPAPAPAASAATMLATFNSTNPNGTWSLYINDDVGGDSGSMTGWCMQIETAPVGPTPTATVAATATATNTPMPTATNTPVPTATTDPNPTGVEVTEFGGQANSGSFVALATLLLFGLALAASFVYRRTQNNGG
jgi:subtilisin-like proprotein convertase family protein